MDYRLRQDERRRRAVAGHVVGLEGDLLDELGGLILEDVLQVYLLGDGHAVVGNSRRDQRLVQDDVLALGTQRCPDRVGELVHTRLHRPPRVGVEPQLLMRHISSLRSS
jgi:hypothetical protein